MRSANTPVGLSPQLGYHALQSICIDFQIPALIQISKSDSRRFLKRPELGSFPRVPLLDKPQSVAQNFARVLVPA